MILSGQKYGKPAVVTGFDPVDILQALLMMVRSSKLEHPVVENQYVRGVSENGNPKAVEVMYQVFEESDALWRGNREDSGQWTGIPQRV